MKQYRSLFRNRNFLLLWLGGAISNIGDFFNGLALVKVLSEDPDRFGLWMALVMVAKVVPGVLLGPVAGVVADRFSRRSIIVASDLVRALLVLGLVFTEQPAAIIALVFLAASASTFHNPAASALLPSLVTREELVTAGSLSVLTQRMAMLLGSGIGAVVLMAVGPHSVFYIDAASFVLSAVIVGAMALPVVAQTETPAASASGSSGIRRFASDVTEVLSFIRQSPPIKRLMTTFAIAAVPDAALNVLLVTFFTVGLGIAAEQIGFVWALFGGASVVGALAIGVVGNRVPWRHLISIGAVYIWAAMMGVLVSHSVIGSVSFLALLGLGSGAINVGATAAIGILVPDEVRGRVFSVWGMMNSLIYVFGVLAAGVLSDAFGPTPVLLGFTTFYLLAGVYSFFAFRAGADSLGANAPAVSASPEAALSSNADLS